MIGKIRNIILLILVIITGLQTGKGQSNTMYYMYGVPQSHFLNPATQPQCRIYIGLPVTSSMEFSYYNSSVGMEDVIWYDSDDGIVKHPLYSDADLEEFLSNFKKANYLSFTNSISLISFGFGIQDMYLNLDLTSKMNERLIYPRDLLVLALEGNTDGQSFDLSTFSVDVSEHLELGIGFSKKFGDQVTVGIRPKILFGLAAMNTTNREFTINTGLREWEVVSDMEVNICTPGLNIPTDDEGVIDFDGDFDADSTLDSFSDYRKLATGNMGLGIDIGAHYRPIEQVEVSLSFIDIGYIKWKNYTHTAVLDGTFLFEGYEENNVGDSIDYLDYVLDSLKSSFRITGSGKEFRTTLSPKLFIGGRYFITPGLDVGALARFDFIEKNVDFSTLLMANWRPSTVFGISLSYGLFDGSPTSFGLGWTLRLGPFSTYFIFDNIPTSYNVIDDVPVPIGFRGFTYRYGINLVFGCNQYKRLRRDKPMYYSEEY
ncbi:MAG: hypothetical protein JW894_12510 [Bacteroidales bacterium]|nr:hypothetical protein [Bacteroidales bacterium]